MIFAPKRTGMSVDYSPLGLTDAYTDSPNSLIRGQGMEGLARMMVRTLGKKGETH